VVAGVLLLAVPFLALASGGFFSSGVLHMQSSIDLAPGITGSATGDLRWLLQTYGMLLPLGLVGLAFRDRHRLLWGVLGLGSIAVVVALKYRYSWDIAKFGALGAIALGVLAARPLEALLRKGRSWHRYLASALLCATTAPGIAFLVTFLLDRDGIPEEIFPSAAPIPAEDHARAISWLRKNMARGELVYVPPSLSSYYAVWGGLPQVWIDGMVERFGFPSELIRERQWLTETLPDTPHAWSRHGIRWFVVDGKIPPLVWLTNRWQAAGIARVRHRSGSVAIVELDR
jgi:hypothetical protein